MTIELAVAFVSGAVVGLVYFLGLWETVRRLPGCGRPWLWLLTSFTVRACVALLGFWGLARLGGLAVLSGLLGFLIARIVLTRLLSPTTGVTP